MNEAGPLDLSALERLRRLGGDAFTCKMMELFRDYGTAKLGEARQALSAGDLPAVAKALHPLKSSAGNVGANRVQELAAQGETLARQPHNDALAATLVELEGAFAAAVSALDQQKQLLADPGAQRT